MKAFLSIDVGTTSVKVALVDVHGEMWAISAQEYSLHTPAENIVELDPQVYWLSCCKGIAEVLNMSHIEASSIASIGICSQGETLICLDANNNPLCNAIVWMDNRSHKEAEVIRQKFDRKVYHSVTGQTEAIATWPVTKIMWLRENKPEVYRKCRKYLLVEDYIIHKLTGRFVGEYSLYSSSFMFDIVERKWWDEILDFAGIDEKDLVELNQSGRIVGEVSGQACREIGLSPKTVVVTGAMDQVAAMVGAGNVRSGIVTETTGAALAVCASLDSFSPHAENSLAVQCHAVADRYMVLGWCPSGGMSLRWMRDKFYTHEMRESTDQLDTVYTGMMAEAQDVPIGCQGLIFLPYLAGPGTLPVDPQTRGSFHSIEMHHGREHFVRAIVESIAFIVRQNIEQMEQIGVACKEIRSLGGGARSSFWSHVKADVCNKPIVRMKTSEAGIIGMAVLQATALGVYDSLESAVENMTVCFESVPPSPENVDRYKAVYREFQEVVAKG